MVAFDRYMNEELKILILRLVSLDFWINFRKEYNGRFTIHTNLLLAKFIHDPIIGLISMKKYQLGLPQISITFLKMLDISFSNI
jgi:hypothetical protein